MHQIALIEFSSISTTDSLHYSLPHTSRLDFWLNNKFFFMHKVFGCFPTNNRTED